MTTDQKVRRGAVRTLVNGVLLVLSLAVIGGWVSTGLYYLELGEQSIVMRLGRYDRTVVREGWNVHLPEPFEYEIVVNTEEQRSAIFGSRTVESADERGDAHQQGTLEGYAGFIQTGDNNIVDISYELQYTVSDAYAYRFAMADPTQILYDAAQAAVREVIGRSEVDAVLYQGRRAIEIAAQRILETTLADYARSSVGGDPFTIDKLSLQTAEPPADVRSAFRAVEAASQDQDRSVSSARGDEQEILERAGALAAEQREGAEAYREAKVLEARGEAARFESVLAEYLRAPEVTRQRLYLETMEEILPGIQKMIVEPNSASVVPIMPFATALPPALEPSGAAPGGQAGGQGARP